MAEPENTDQITACDWVKIYDFDVTGVVKKVGNDPTPWALIRTEGNQEFVVPQQILQRAAPPVIDRAAAAILDILCEFDPSWRQVDTLDIRRRMVVAAREQT